MIEVTTAWSTAEVYLHGAHVTHFQKQNEPPLLFLSRVSRFDAGHPIRGGIPIIFPWFGPREGKPAHGFARLKAWDLKEIVPATNGSVRLRLGLPQSEEASEFPPFTVEYSITVGAALELELAVTNTSKNRDLVFENCLHTYFNIGAIDQIEVAGLKGCAYLERAGGGSVRREETGDAIRIEAEVDRAYLKTAGAVEILDRAFCRRIRVEKTGSNSTVVWNPWIAKAQAMSDFGDEEYRQMVCVESGNIMDDKLSLPPGRTAQLTARISSAPLGNETPSKKK